MSCDKLQWGLKNGKTYYIDEVESGLDCNCVCPNCGRRLIAKNNKFVNGRERKMIIHFAHYNPEGVEIKCHSGFETGIHLAAKEIIETNTEIALPALKSDIKYLGEATISESKTIHYEEVFLEKQIEDIRPDVIIKINDKELIIEVAVTHPVDKKKKNKIKEIGISAFEITLKPDEGKPYDRKTLISEVLYNEKNRKWVYNARKKELKKKYIKDNSDKIEKKEEEEEERKGKEKQKKEYLANVQVQREKHVSENSAIATKNLDYSKNREYLFDLNHKEIIKEQPQNKEYWFVENCPKKIISSTLYTQANIVNECEKCDRFKGYRYSYEVIICIDPKSIPIKN